MLKDLKLYFIVFAVFLAFIAGIYLGGKITFGAMESLRAENKGLIKQAASLRQEKEVRDLADKIIECESGGRHDIYGDGGKSFGVAQFQIITFNELKDKAEMHWLNYRKKEDQITLLKWALQNNYGYHWTCYKMIAKMEGLDDN